MRPRSALKNLEIMEREDVVGNVQRNERYLQEQLRGLMERHEIIGDVRGAGYFRAFELVKDRATRETFAPRSATCCCATSSPPRFSPAG